MDWSTRCAAVIPCLNEAAHIRAVVAGVRKHVAKVIVIDDGSSDATQVEAANAGAEVIRHDTPRGKGAALRTGWKHAQSLGFPWALALDGDGQHAPDDVPTFFHCAERTAASLVIGNRLHDAKHMPPVRRFVNRWMSRRLSTIARESLPDTQCGFRLMDLQVWSQLQLRTEHFEVESEVLLAFLAGGHRVEFVPIRVIYKTEQSKIHPWRDTVRWFQWLRTRR